MYIHIERQREIIQLYVICVCGHDCAGSPGSTCLGIDVLCSCLFGERASRPFWRMGRVPVRWTHASGEWKPSLAETPTVNTWWELS